MHCSQCGSSIDYRFPTTCLNCHCELVTASNDSQQLINGSPERKARLKVKHHLVNMTTTLATSFAGLFVGAVVTYFGGWCFYLLFYKAGVVGDLSCGGGNALGMLLLLVGANVGSTCGGIFGFANRIYKPAL